MFAFCYFNSNNILSLCLFFLPFSFFRFLSSNSGDSKMPNVLNIVRKMNAMRAKISALQKKTVEVNTKRLELETSVQSQLIQNYESIKRVVDVSNFAFEDQAWRKAFSDVLLVSPSAYVPLEDENVGMEASKEDKLKITTNMEIHRAGKKGNSDKENAESGADACEMGSTKSLMKMKSGIQGNSGSSSSGGINNINGSSLTAVITESQFDKVPLSVRGKVRFEDVQVALMAVARKKGMAVTLKELGLSGRTGECIVNTLKKLNLIDTNKSSVFLLSKRERMNRSRGVR
jgi:hypothetical protein